MGQKHFDYFSPFDETLRHIKLCNSVISQIQRNICQNFSNSVQSYEGIFPVGIFFNIENIVESSRQEEFQIYQIYKNSVDIFEYLNICVWATIPKIEPKPNSAKCVSACIRVR